MIAVRRIPRMFWGYLTAVLLALIPLFILQKDFYVVLADTDSSNTAFDKIVKRTYENAFSQVPDVERKEFSLKGWTRGR